MLAIQRSFHRSLVIVLWVGIILQAIPDLVLPTTAKAATTTAELTPFPAPLLQCKVTAECEAVRGACGEWVIVNKSNVKGLQNYFRQKAAQSQCAVAKTTTTPKVECHKNFCATSAAPGSGEASVALWKDQCPEKEIEGSLDGLDEEVKAQVVRLHSTLGWERQEAVEALGKMGTDANKAIPWVLSLLKNRESIAVSNAAKCLVGELPSEEVLIANLGRMSPKEHPAIPLFVEWLKDDKQLYRHADILKQLAKMGPKASEALGIIEDILEQAHDKSWNDERGVLALEVVSGLGSKAKGLLPAMSNWVEQNSKMKSRLFQMMANIDVKSAHTKKAALHCLKQEEDVNCRILALHVLQYYPSELAEQQELLKKMLTSTQLAPYRMAALKTLQSMGTKAKPLVEDVTKLGLQNQEDVRRLAALVLRSIDSEGKQSLSTLKKKVYQGFAFEPQYLWKVINSSLTQVELLKSYFYFVAGKRYKFTDLKIAPEMERLLVNCVNSSECPNRTSAMSAVVLLKSEDPRLRGFLGNAMKSSEPAIRWDASGAYILMYGQNEYDLKKDKELAKAWALQEEALKQGGAVRLIDLEDIILATERDADKKFHFVLQLAGSKVNLSENLEWLDVLLLMANKDIDNSRQTLIDLIKRGDKQMVLNLVSRVTLMRDTPSPWLKELNQMALRSSESSIQEVAGLNQLDLGLN